MQSPTHRLLYSAHDVVDVDASECTHQKVHKFGSQIGQPRIGNHVTGWARQNTARIENSCQDEDTHSPRQRIHHSVLLWGKSEDRRSVLAPLSQAVPRLSERKKLAHVAPRVPAEHLGKLILHRACIAHHEATDIRTW